MGSKQFRKYPNGRARNIERRKNYESGRFGSRKGFGKESFSSWEMKLVVWHLVPDRWLAKRLGISVNGVQAFRWRIRVNYKGMYR